MEQRKYGQLDLKERIEIYRLHADGKSVRSVARSMGRSASTISRELRRNSQGTRVWPAGRYEPLRAQGLYERRHARGRLHKLERQPDLRNRVRDLLAMERSPEQIAGRLTLEEGKAVISYESIYRYIHWHSYHYRTEEWHKLLPRKRRRRRSNRSRPGIPPIPCRTPLCKRPAGAVNRSRKGHFEGDLMQFSKAGKSVLVVYDRKSRYTFLRWQETRKATDVLTGLQAIFDTVPSDRKKTITFDNGQEFRLHTRLAEAHDLKTFFCEPHSPWQKGGFKTPAEVFFNQSVALQT